MQKLARLRILSAILLIGLATMPAWATSPKDASGKAPVPAEIGFASTAFISNGGGQCESSQIGPGSEEDRPYNEFYAAMKKWGRYRLAGSPARAELDLEISFACPAAGTNVTNGDSLGALYNPQLRLVISDIRTRVVLWTITKHVHVTQVFLVRRNNFGTAMKELVSDVKSLAPARPTRRKH